MKIAHSLGLHFSFQALTSLNTLQEAEAAGISGLFLVMDYSFLLVVYLIPLARLLFLSVYFHIVKPIIPEEDINDMRSNLDD
jgi:hypothetical protein